MTTIVERIVSELPEMIVVAVKPQCHPRTGELVSRGAHQQDEMVRYLKGRHSFDAVCCSENSVVQELSRLIHSEPIVTPVFNDYETKGEHESIRDFFLAEPAEGRSCKTILRQVRHFIYHHLRQKDKVCIATDDVNALCVWKVLTGNNVKSWCALFGCERLRPGSISVYERRAGRYDVKQWNVIPGNW